jgi:hypothetical protein
MTSRRSAVRSESSPAWYPIPAKELSAQHSTSTPRRESTCARTLKLEGAGVFLHVQVTDYSTVEALAKVTDIWARSFPNNFRDGLYIHDLHQDWTRHDVEGNRGRLAVSAFETDQPGHAGLCRSDQLVTMVRLMESRLP